MTKFQIIKLKNELPSGWAQLLAIEFGYKQDYIRKVINGDRPNLYIVQAAIRLAAETKINHLKLVEQISVSLESL